MSNPLPSHVEEFLADYLKQPPVLGHERVEHIGPTIHVRIHSDYQSSIKALVPDVTVTVDAPLPFHPASLQDAAQQAQRFAMQQFQEGLQRAWEEIKKVNEELK